jgi:MarR-like DNA-binding transcriptional regulator SgrR of sgrS sRNA
MSILVINHVFDHSEEKVGARLVLLAMARFADDTGGSIFPSLQRLAEAAHISERHCRRILRHLEASGAIITERISKGGRGRTSRYRINLNVTAA